MYANKFRLLIFSLVCPLLLLAARGSGQSARIVPRSLQLETVGRQHGQSPQAENRKWILTSTASSTLDLRTGSAAVYDASTNSMILFGGFLYGDAANDVKSLNNANGLDSSDWVTIIPDGAPGAPAPRTSHTAVYDSANSRMIVFGGCSFTGLICTTLLNDVWVLSNANGVAAAPAWTQLSPAGRPPAGRWGHVAAYDPATNRMIVFGGEDQSGTPLSDAWLLSNANGLGGTPAWTQLTPSGGPPTGVDFGSAVYDAANNVLVEFAGVSQNGALTNSVWALSHASGSGGTPAWTQLIANGSSASPAKRWGQIAVYDNANNRMIIFGGASASTKAVPELNDVWVLANANGLSGTPKWTRLAIGGSKPSPRVDDVGFYDSSSNRLVIHGGGSSDGGFFSPWILTGANGLP